MTAWDVARRPYRGHEAAIEDSMPKGVEGYVVPFARRARPFGGGHALVAYLIGRGSSPSGRFGDFLLSFLQLRVDDN